MELNIFCWNFAHVSYLPMSAKVFDLLFDFLLFRSWVICKNKKRPGFFTLAFSIFINNSRSKQNKKNPEHLFVDIVKYESCAKFQQKILIFVVFGTRQSFQFLRQIAWFLGNNRAFSKFSYRIFHNVINITKL